MTASTPRKKPSPPPEFCTFACRHSEFPPADSAGICRTMAAVYCKRFRRLVEKNLPCHWEKAKGR